MFGSLSYFWFGGMKPQSRIRQNNESHWHHYWKSDDVPHRNQWIYLTRSIFGLRDKWELISVSSEWRLTLPEKLPLFSISISFYILALLHFHNVAFRKHLNIFVISFHSTSITKIVRTNVYSIYAISPQ